MGGSFSDYASVSPSHSFIHTESFRTVKELADYLLMLDANDHLYNAYFAWKEEGRVDTNTFTSCRLCMVAHEADNLPASWYVDASEWWSTNQCRTSLDVELV
ncbi:unnamed protein product [Protopolystoma xenopodis]|uniref:Fucosyltransferase n=1 Tax=Protopolystoma xenopodis TaxID=117903 RepID=A0A448XHI5_9PLAT|nr:unnamed protein product [Protopolystoma xenopodis]